MDVSRPDGQTCGIGPAGETCWFIPAWQGFRRSTFTEKYLLLWEVQMISSRVVGGQRCSSKGGSRKTLKYVWKSRSRAAAWRSSAVIQTKTNLSYNFIMHLENASWDFKNIIFSKNRIWQLSFSDWIWCQKQLSTRGGCLANTKTPQWITTQEPLGHFKMRLKLGLKCQRTQIFVRWRRRTCKSYQSTWNSAAKWFFQLVMFPSAALHVEVTDLKFLFFTFDAPH